MFAAFVAQVKSYRGAIGIFAHVIEPRFSGHVDAADVLTPRYQSEATLSIFAARIKSLSVSPSILCVQISTRTRPQAR